MGDRSCPARRDGPSCGASCGRRRALILVVPAERVVPQAAVDRPEGWLCRPPPRSERPGHDAALDPHPGEPVPIPVPGRATSSKRRGSANKGRRRRALRRLLSWAVHASCSTTSGPPPGCTTRSGGSRATPWTCPGRQGRAISPTPTWFPHATMMSSRSARARMTVLAAHGTPPDGNSLHPPPSGPMGRQPTSAPLHSKRKTKRYARKL